MVITAVLFTPAVHSGTALLGAAETTTSTWSGFFGTGRSQVIGSHLPEASWVLLATSHSAESGALAVAIRTFTWPAGTAANPRLHRFADSVARGSAPR